MATSKMTSWAPSFPIINQSFTSINPPLILNPYSKTFTLNTGDKIPAIGLGTWQSKPNEVRDAVKIALKKGYRHIDTALAYGNEHEVGQGIKDSGVPREEIWLTTKLDNTWHHIVPKGLAVSLQSLGTDYVDLYLMVSDSIWERQTLAEWSSTGRRQQIRSTRRSIFQIGTSSKHGKPHCTTPSQLRSSPMPTIL